MKLVIIFFSLLCAVRALITVSSHKEAPIYPRGERIELTGSEGLEFRSPLEGPTVYNAPIHDSPHQVSLQYYHIALGWRHFCSASIIDRCYILTTRLCLSNWESLSAEKLNTGVIAGAYSLRDHEEMMQFDRAEYAYVHPFFKSSTREYDFVIVRLHDCFKFNDRVKPIELSPKCDLSHFVTSGWNLLHHSRTETDITKTQAELKNITVFLTSRHECLDEMHKEWPETIFCAKNHVRKYEVWDQGGPVVHNNVLAGITILPEYSWKEHTFPWAFSNVSYAREWIDVVISDTMTTNNEQTCNNEASLC